MYICIYVYTYTRIYVYMYICIYVYTYVPTENICRLAGLQTVSSCSRRRRPVPSVNNETCVVVAVGSSDLQIKLIVGRLQGVISFFCFTRNVNLYNKWWYCVPQMGACDLGPFAAIARGFKITPLLLALACALGINLFLVSTKNPTCYQVFSHVCERAIRRITFHKLCVCRQQICISQDTFVSVSV